MKTSVRFENVVSKLYTAFHENRLNAMDCCACAVGNICNNSSEWMNGYAFNNRNVPSHIQKYTGYSSEEFGSIETLFLYGNKNAFNEMSKFDSSRDDKETQFKGLCAVVEYLCELEGIPNIMDYTSLFETENDKPKHELQTVF